MVEFNDGQGNRCARLHDDDDGCDRVVVDKVDDLCDEKEDYHVDDDSILANLCDDPHDGDRDDPHDGDRDDRHDGDRDDPHGDDRRDDPRGDDPHDSDRRDNYGDDPRGDDRHDDHDDKLLVEYPNNTL